MPKTAQKGASVATVKKQGAVMKHIKKYWQWYAMMFIPIVYYIVFRYIPRAGYRHGAVSGCLRRLRQLHGCKHHQHR